MNPPSGKSIGPAVVSAAENNDAARLVELLDKWAASASPDPPRGPPRQFMYPFQSALDKALEGGHVEAADELLRRGCDVNADAVTAASTGSTEALGWNLPVFDCMLKNGWDINQRLAHWGDALLLSVATGNDVLVRYLLGALSLLCFESPRRNLSSVLLGGSAGPLEIGPPQTSDVAERAQGRAIIQVSLAYHESAETYHGADPNRNRQSTPVARTVLEAACYSPSTPLVIVENLIGHGAEVRESIALLAAAWAGRTDVLTLLLKHGGQDVINQLSDKYISEAYAKNEQNGTPLHGAAYRGHIDAVKLLLENGARKDLKNAAGFTPGEVAERAGKVECAKLLK